VALSQKIAPATIAAICIGYVLVRLWNLSASCLWFDEIFSVHAADHPWNELFSFVALDLIHPPLFYVRLKLWMDIVGDDVFSLRLLPVIISAIAIIPFLLLCRELKLRTWVTALALFLLAINGSLIKYAQEVRMYSLLMCLSLFSMWLFARYFNRGKSLAWLLLVNVLVVYSHYFGWFVVSAEVLAILIFQRTKWRPIVAMFGVVVASFLPWMIAVWRAAQSGSALGQNIGWMSRPGPREIWTFIIDLIEPFYYQASNAEPTSIWRVSAPILLIILIAVVLYFAYWNQRTDDEKRRVYFLSIFAGLPIIAAFIVSWLLPYSIWGTRHLIIAFPPLAILAAIALSAVSLRWLRVAAITLIVLFSVYAFALYATRRTPQYSWCAWEQLGTDINASETPVFATEDLIAYHLWFARRKEEGAGARMTKVDGLEGVNEDKAFFLPRGFDAVSRKKLDEINDSRLWLALRFEKDPMPKDPPLRDFLKAGYRIVDQKSIGTSEGTSAIVLLEK
jgi:uncharacterized membrane protein